MNNINTVLADILEIPTITDSDVLEANPLWDSLAVLTLLAHIDKEYDVQLFSSDLYDIKTLSDIKNLIKSKKK